MRIVAFETLELDEMEQFLHLPRAGFFIAYIAQTQLDVFLDGPPGKQAILLINHSDLAFRLNFSGRRLVITGRNVEKRCLAAAGRSHNGDELSGKNVEAYFL